MLVGQGVSRRPGPLEDDPPLVVDQAVERSGLILPGAEAGVEPVDRRAPLEGALDDGPAGSHARPDGFVDLHGRTFESDPRELLERDPRGRQDDALGAQRTVGTVMRR